jgi:hypothetical protein
VHVDDLVVLQTGPETFRILGDGRDLTATVAHHTRRGLGLHGVPPVQVATELARFLLERGALPDGGAAGTGRAGGDRPVELAALAGRHAGFVDELRSRLA